MKTKICILFVCILFSASSYAQDSKLYIYCPNPDIDETSCGFVNSRHEIVIPVGKYNRIYSTEFEHIAFVSIKGKKGIYAINRAEKILFEVYRVDNGPDYVVNGLYRIVGNRKIGFADMSGKIVIKPMFDFAYPFQKNGIAVFCEGGIIKKTGEYTIREGGKWGAVNRQGETVISPIYEDGRTRELRKGSGWYYINNQQKLELVRK